jgi:5-hydroxyisourate hydrolase
MSTVTTQVTDTMRGLPAVGMAVLLERAGEGGMEPVGRGVTDVDGRIHALVPEGQPLLPGTYRLSFDTEAYFRATGVEGLYPEVSVVFAVRGDGEGPYHLPLLLSPHGFTAYRAK